MKVVSNEENVKRKQKLAQHINKNEAFSINGAFVASQTFVFCVIITIQLCVVLSKVKRNIKSHIFNTRKENKRLKLFIIG